MYSVTLSIEDVFKGANNRTVPCAYATPTANGLLENVSHFTEKTRNRQGAFQRYIGALQRSISGFCFLIFFNVFHHYAPFALC